MEVVRYLIFEEGVDVNEGGMGFCGFFFYIVCCELGLGFEWVKFLVEYGFSIN